MENQLIVTTSIKVADGVFGDSSTIDKVNSMLLEQMERVKENPGNIDQAEAMSSVAGRIMDGLKVKVAAASLIIKSLKE